MAAKRHLGESCSDPADEPAKAKRLEPLPSFASVIGDAVMVNCLSTALEPVLRRVVKEEVDRSLRNRIRFFSRSPSLQIQAPEPSTLELIFPKALTLPIFTGSKIVDEESNQLRVMLVDTMGNQMAPMLFLSPIKVDIVVLDGDFPSVDGKSWSSEEFDRSIVRERSGKRPLLTGELAITVRDGVGLIGDIEFTDNSSWIRSRKFRIGAKVAEGSSNVVRIREAMTEAFVVKDHRGELYKKHHPPMLGDEVWRLEKISKDGVFHKRLSSAGINTVQDFLKMWAVDHAKLRSVLGIGMSEKMWNVTIKHAKTCVMGNKFYVFQGSNCRIWLNPICQLVKAEINGSLYHTTHNLSDINKAYLENLVRQAYANWSSLEEIEGISNEIGLLTQVDHVVDPYPNQQQTIVRPFQQNAYLADCLIEEYLPSEMQVDADKVFGPSCVNETVYEGVKNVALSALGGINATIFAYGQTSSGKTYTMRGIADKAVNDIYQHIMNTPERDFTIKISGLEIYNENVRDLLNSESGRNLKLLDDPEKGTMVEKLVEETASNDQHLRHLISICEAQRQVGETALNDSSSRSHQIIRLTIESTLRENSDCVRSFVASLNFVDLAGSERASQTNADGARLREGCHINLSLMTLTTVIRKLSVGKRSGHIPYRDSKLTRILQHSLGGNARTAIICTLSPALSHFEQSRNTLFFATRAKEVTNTAEVNMVVSNKQLVKHLQKEVARLEAELRTPDPSREKDLKIQQMKMEIEELKRQRDLAQSQVDELRRKLQEDQQTSNPFESPNPSVKKCLSYSDVLSPKLDGKDLGRHDRTRKTMLLRQSMRQSSTAPFTLMHEIRKLEHLQEQLGEEANRALEVLQKEVACHRLGNQDAAETIAKLQAEIREMQSVRSISKEVEVGTAIAPNKSVSANLKEEITRLHSQGSTIANLEEQLENVQKSIDKLVMSLPSNQEPNSEAIPKTKNQSKKKKLLPLTSSHVANRQNFLKSPCSPLSTTQQVAEPENEENRPPEDDDIISKETITESEKGTTMKSEDGGDVSSKEGTPGYRRSSSVNMKKMQKMFQNAAEENVRSIRAYVTELKERVAKLQYQKQLLVCQVLELEANEAAGYNVDDDESAVEPEEPQVAWHITFREQRQQIIELWDVCYVSIIHRTQFYLLFKGDPADQIYMEVELRRLNWLQQHFAELGNASPAVTGDEPTVSLSSSIRALKREREFLAKRLTTRLSFDERDALYIKWNVPLDGKHRRLQFINKLWTDPHDPKHIEESAQIVAKLVGFCESGNLSKEMFELNFALPADKKPWMAGPLQRKCGDRHKNCNEIIFDKEKKREGFQHLGKGVPQVEATFLAFGVLTNFFRFGFPRYWQRQGFCSLILLQHNRDGGDDVVMAPTQGLSCAGLHVTAVDISASASSRSNTTAAAANTAVRGVFILLFTCDIWCRIWWSPL
ncbi:hypothetical protein V6N13_077489 [Hibiscus sabdariffa]